MTAPLANLLSGNANATATRAKETSKANAGALQRRQAAIGVGLALLVIVCWAVLHQQAIFAIDLKTGWPFAPLIVALQCWLYVGLFHNRP